MANSDHRFTSDYSRKEVDFLKSMGDRPKPIEKKTAMPENWVVLVITPNVDRGILVCRQLTERLGSKIRVIRINNPSTISALMEVFDPEVMLSDSNSIYQSENGTEAGISNTMNSMALFINKKDSTFSRWIRENSLYQPFFNAWAILNE